MLVVYQAQNLTDAQFLVDRLQSHGIPTFVRNEAFQGALGELPLTLRPEVCVLVDSDFERAVELARQHDEAMRSSVVTAERTCAACGETSPANFELCWKCGAPLVDEQP